MKFTRQVGIWRRIFDKMRRPCCDFSASSVKITVYILSRCRDEMRRQFFTDFPQFFPQAWSAALGVRPDSTTSTRQGRSEMSQHEYTTPLFIYDDGTLAVHGGDIRGLVIEADTLDEMRAELHRLAPRLLRSNHGLTDEEIEHASLCVVLHDVEDAARPVSKSRTPQYPKLLWEDDPRIMTCA